MLTKLLADIKSKKSYDLVAVPTMEMLGDSLPAIKEIIEEFHEYGVSVYNVNDDYFSIKNQINQNWENTSKNRIKVPYGYDLKNGKILVNESKKLNRNVPIKKRKPGDVVKWIFTTFDKYPSYAEVAKRLNKKKVPPPIQIIKEKRFKRSHSSQWNRQQVKNIINNEFYLGNEINGQNHAPLIDITLWEQVQEKIKLIQR